MLKWKLQHRCGYNTIMLWLRVLPFFYHGDLFHDVNVNIRKAKQKKNKCFSGLFLFWKMPGRVAQSVTCLATDACLTADPGVASSIPVRSHTFVEIDHENSEMISTVILPLPLIHSRRVVVSYKRKYVHELLVNRLFKPAQEKVWLGELTVQQWP